MFKLISIELYKIFQRPRTYIGFVAIAVLVTIIEVAFYFDGERYVDFATQSLKETFIFTGKLMNGYLVCYIVLQGLIVHVPLLVSLVAGELLAGEASAGTFRFLLIRPLSRSTIVWAKYFTACIYTILLVMWLATVSLGLGLCLFGGGELLVMKTESLTIFEANDVLWRFLSAFGFAKLSMCTVAALALFFSSIVENAIGPIVSTMVVIIICIVISAMDISFLKTIKPYMFTTHMNAWKEFFEVVVNKKNVLQSMSILIAHIILFVGLANYIFKRKDILT